MIKKLTLTVDEKIIQEAKTYAAAHNESLSHMVENYFRALTTPGDTHTPLSETVALLMGSVHVPEDFDYEKAKREYLEERYAYEKTVH